MVQHLRWSWAVRGIVAAVSLAVLTSCGSEPPTAIECSIDVSDVVETLVLTPTDGTVRMLRNQWNPTERSGTARFSEYRYDLAFPRTPESSAVHYRIDRRTLQADRWFVDPQGESYMSLEATCRALEEVPEATIVGN